MDIVLLGPPGAGKGTQGEILSERLDIPRIATGDVLRAAVRDGTPQGRAARAFMERGDLVPDDVILGIMKEALSAPPARRGSILDGVVRTEPQAEGLARTLNDLGRQVDVVLYFDVAEEELVRRLSGRTVCEKCQTPYKGKEPGAECERPGCGGRLVRRPDDEPEAVRNRLANYRRDTLPVLDWYRSAGARVETVDAVGPVEDVTRRALQAVDGGERRP